MYVEILSQLNMCLEFRKEVWIEDIESKQYMDET